MEMHLPLFFSPNISTTVRFAAGLVRHRLAFRLLAPLAPLKAGARARRLFLTPPRHRFRDAELAALEEASPFTVSMPTGRLIGWRWGRREDPVVVLAHGWGGRAAQLRSYVAPLVARGYSVVGFDAPGHGMTGGRESSVVHMAAALEAVLKEKQEQIEHIYFYAREDATKALKVLAKTGASHAKSLIIDAFDQTNTCLLYTSPSPRD